MGSSRYDLAIIGGGAAGLSAAIYAIRSNLKIVLLEENILGGQVNMTDEIDNYLGFKKIKGFELSQKFKEHAKSYDFDIINKKVIKLEKKNFLYELTLLNNNIINSYAVILATGGHPKKLGIINEKELYGNGVSYCATCDGFFFKDKTVIVVGGGNTAVEESIYLSNICKKVFLSHRRNKLRANKALQKKIMENKKITLLWDTSIISIKSKNNEIKGVILKNLKDSSVKELKIDGLFIFIGYEPNNELTPNTVKKNIDGTIITNERCETNMPGLYAIGDLRSKVSRQIILSAADGCNASISAEKYIENIKKTNSN